MVGSCLIGALAVVIGCSLAATSTMAALVYFEPEIALLFALLAGHALVDFSLQTEWMARAKSRHAGPPAAYDPKLHGPVQAIWPYVLSAHALQHGLAVYLVTGQLVLGLAETVAHALIDFAKCERLYGIHTDQALHVACKVLWIAMLGGAR